MPELSQPSVQDEALRRARLDDQIRNALRWIAARYRDRRPHILMTEGGRLAIALSAAEHACGGPSDAADALERELLMRMPHVGHPITRGEYALILDRASWRA